uniref:Uncharacterized protein n=1 Tax=Daphnia magna TaxID=35525 RepID=A0A0P6GLH7_9CRUS
MKFLVLVLAVAVVAGNIFHRPFSTQLKPSWPIVSSPAYQHPFLTSKGSYYHQSQPKDCEEHQNYISFYDYFPFYPYPTNIQQGVYSGQPRSPAAKKNDQSQDWQKILKQRSRWNQKFFLLDNEAQTVHALRPFNPLEMFSYHINQIKPSAPLTRPIFARRSTVFFTITETTRKIDVQICIPSTLFTSPSLPTQCPTYNRTIRHFKSYDDLLEGENIRPSSTSPVMPTVLDIQSQKSPVYSIESSKDEDLNEERDLGYYEMEELTRRDRAMFGWPTTRTVTVVATQTSIVTRAVSPMHPPIGSPTGFLICVPPGLVVCV